MGWVPDEVEVAEILLFGFGVFLLGGLLVVPLASGLMPVMSGAGQQAGDETGSHGGTGAAAPTETVSPSPTPTATPTQTPTPSPTPTPTATPVPDTDGDGLANGFEKGLETSPYLADSDADGLNDSYELQLETDPMNADTDGDNLYDALEVRSQNGNESVEPALPDADPLHKDLYIVYSVHEGGEMLTERERAAVVEAFDKMRVGNPDGSTGIRVHDSLRPWPSGQLNRTLVISDDEEWDEIAGADWRKDILGDRYGYYHHVLIVDYPDSTGVGGEGASPGPFVTIDDEGGGSVAETPRRSVYTIHELLHNIVGHVEPVDETGHTDGGWLVPKIPETEQYLTDELASYLSDEGFTP